MNAAIIILLLLACGGILFMTPTHAPTALLLAAAGSAITIYCIFRARIETRFLLRVFSVALLIRLVLGACIFVFGLQEFFGGDAGGYDLQGHLLQQGWHGNKFYAQLAQFYMEGAGAWGMIYLVAGVYELVGRNPLAIQFISAVFGSATPIVIFLCAQQIFENRRVSRAAAVLTAFFPSLVLWSSLGLKDGPIFFVLALSILATLKLGERLSIKYALILTAGLFALLSLRFYVFYMMVVAVFLTLLIGTRKITGLRFVQQMIAIAVIGLGLMWFGVLRYANEQYERFGSLETVQRSRLDLASAGSGFNREADVSTTMGALSAIPSGLVYLLFAPFPWELDNLRQKITLPEMIVWWACFPLLILGMWFSIRHRLRKVFPILVFTIMLSLGYSVLQGNVGTAYRQRAQLFVFYFIFVAVGFILLKERQEERTRQYAEEGLEELRVRESGEKKQLSPPGLIDAPAPRIQA